MVKNATNRWGQLSKILLWLLLFFTGALFGQNTVTIGSGGATSLDFPFSAYFGYSYTQQIYTQAQINTLGNIEKIRFYYSSSDAPITNSDAWVIYMGHTSKTTFSSTNDWVPVGSLTQVFNSTVTFPGSAGWMEITLSTPFSYNNTDNLVIAVDENSPGWSTRTAYWSCFTSGASTGIYFRNDGTNPDPASPPTADNTSSAINQIQLDFAATNMAFTSATTEQGSTSGVMLGATNQEIIRLKVVTTGSSNPFNVTSVTFNTAGSTAAVDISNARAYYTTSSTFSTAVPFGSAVANPSGSFAVTGTQVLAGGNNYFWLAYDVAGGATENNVVDGTCTQFITSEAKTTRTPDVTNPTGYRTIKGAMNGDYTVGLETFNQITGRNLTIEKRTRQEIVIEKIPIRKENKVTVKDVTKSENKPESISDETEYSSEELNPGLEFETISKAIEVEYSILVENGVEYTGEQFVEGKTTGIEGTLNYPSLTAAIADLNERGVSGPVRFLLNDAVYSAETLPLVINIQNEHLPTATNTVTIKPNTGVTASITGASANASVILIKNSYIIIDGSNTAGGTTRNLSITNTSATTPKVILIGSTGTTPIVGSTLKNCIIINGAQTSSSVNVYAANGATGYFNNITIQNNSIQKGYFGIYVLAVVSSGNGSGTLITQNDLNTAGANSVRLAGVCVQGIDGAIISNNNIGNMVNTADAVNLTGVWLDNGTINCLVSGNTISSISGTATAPRGIAISSAMTGANINITGNTISGLTSSYSGTTYGIYLFSTTSGVTIQKNVISNIKNTNTSGYSAIGIALASTLTSNAADVFNNLISDVAGYGWNSQINYNGYGINILSGGGYKIYFNSINLATNQTTGVPACLIINSAIVTAGSLDIRNNIFSIPATVGTNRYAVICNAANTVFSNINQNAYFTSGPNLGYIGATDRTDLAAWRIGTGNDVNSLSKSVTFVSATDLHINPSDWVVNGQGIPIAAIDTDIDGNSRSTNITNGPVDIGADEYSPSGIATATPSGTIGHGSTTTYTGVDGKTVATISWADTYTENGPLFPTSVTLTYTPGKRPVNNSNVLISQGIDRMFTITPDIIGYDWTATVRLYYNSSTELRGFTESALRVNRRPDAGDGIWTVITPTTINTTLHYAEFTTTSFSTFGIDDGVTPLPVELASFNVLPSGQKADLKWTTKTEVNSYQFVIERSLSSHSSSLSSHLLWEKVGEVDASGNSNSPKEYSFTDKNLAEGKYSYRLKMIDNDGTFEYSQVVEVEIEMVKDFALSQNYPNPFNPVTQIQYQLPVNSQVKLVIYSITGETVRTLVDESQTAGSYTIPFDASGLASGTYIYRLIAGDFVSTKKLVVLK